MHSFLGCTRDIEGMSHGRLHDLSTLPRKRVKHPFASMFSKHERPIGHVIARLGAKERTMADFDFPRTFDLSRIPAHLRKEAMHRIAQSLCESLRTFLGSRVYVRNCTVRLGPSYEPHLAGGGLGEQECRIDAYATCDVRLIVSLELDDKGHVVIDTYTLHEPPDPDASLMGIVGHVLRVGLACLVSYRVSESFLLQYKAAGAGPPDWWIFVGVILISFAVPYLMIGWVWRLVGCVLYFISAGRVHFGHSRKTQRGAAASLMSDLKWCANGILRHHAPRAIADATNDLV